jgi:hypothetical protein
MVELSAETEARNGNCLFQTFRLFVAFEIIQSKVQQYMNAGEGYKIYKKLWEELIAYFHFAVILASEMTNINKTFGRMRNKVNKTIQFGILHYWYY